jgi:hypothetical protein
MVKRLELLLGVAGWLLAPAAWAGVLDFETRADGTPFTGLVDGFAPSEYAAEGASLFAGSAGAPLTVHLADATGVAGLAGTSVGLAGYYLDVAALAGEETFLEVTFGQPLFAVEFDYALAAGHSLDVAFFDATGALPIAFGLTPSAPFSLQSGAAANAGHIAVSGFGPIHRLRLSTDTSVIILDNLDFQASGVPVTPAPEPGSLALSAIGILGVAAGLRRRAHTRGPALV